MTRRVGLALACVLGCGPSADPGAHGSGEGGGEASSTTGHPLGWSCGDGVVVTGEYCFREYTLPGLAVLEIGIGDLNHDGRDEIVVQTRDDIRSYAVHDDGTFELLQSWGDGVSSGKVLDVGDFDADGRRDVVRRRSQGGDYYRQLEDGSMALVSGIDPLRGPTSGVGYELIFDADLDGHEDYFLWIWDPTYELGPARRAGHRLEDGAWVPVGTGIEFWSSVYRGVVADIDGDGHAEPIMLVRPEDALDPDPFYPTTFDWKSVYLGHVKPDGSGLELGAKLTPGFYATKVDVGDLDGDGHLDVILYGEADLVYEEGASLSVIYWGHGDFTFDGPEPLGEPRGTIFDLDGDGVDELFGGGVLWRYVDGAFQAFDQPQPLIDARFGRRCDVNGDGVDDYVRSTGRPTETPVIEADLSLVVLMSDP